MFGKLDCDPVLPVDYRGLQIQGIATKSRTTMIGDALEVGMMANFPQQPGFTNPGQTTDTDQRHFRGRLFQLIEQETPHRLVTALHQRKVNALLAQPLLGCSRAQPTAKAIQKTLRVFLAEI